MVRKPQICSGNVRSRLEYLSLAMERKSSGRFLYGSRVRPWVGSFLPDGFPSGGYWESMARAASLRASGSRRSFLGELVVVGRRLVERRRRLECDRVLERDLLLPDDRRFDGRLEWDLRVDADLDDVRWRRRRLELLVRSGVLRLSGVALSLRLEGLDDVDLDLAFEMTALSTLSDRSLINLMIVGSGGAVVAGTAGTTGDIGGSSCWGITTTGSVCVDTPAILAVVSFSGVDRDGSGVGCSGKSRNGGLGVASL